MSAQKKKVNINLVIKEDQAQSFSEQFLSWALTYGRYIIIITQIVVLLVFFLRFKLDRDHTDLKESVSQKQAIVESVSDLEAEFRKTQDKISNIRLTTTNQNLFPQVMHFLAENMPSDTNFTSIALTTDKISLSATAANLRSFSFLLRQLQKDSKLTEVSLEDILRRNDGRIEFKIKAKINLKSFT